VPDDVGAEMAARPYPANSHAMSGRTPENSSSRPMSMRPNRPTSHARRPARRRAKRKTLDIDQQLLDRARGALGTKTGAETVRQALEAVVRRNAQIEGIMRLSTLGPIDVSSVVLAERSAPGCALVTANIADLERIGRHLEIDVALPFPG